MEEDYTSSAESLPQPENHSTSSQRVIGHEVTLVQTGAKSVDADRAIVRQGGVGMLKTEQADITSSGVALAQGARINLVTSQAVAILGREQVNMDQSAAQVLVSTNDVRMEQSGAVALLARNVQVEKNSGVVFLIAQNVTGDVHPLYGPREALVFGAVAGLVGGLVFLFSKLLKGRSKL